MGTCYTTSTVSCITLFVLCYYSYSFSLLLIKRKGFIPIQLVDENTLLSSDKSTSYHADYSIPGN